MRSERAEMAVSMNEFLELSNSPIWSVINFLSHLVKLNEIEQIFFES